MRECRRVELESFATHAEKELSDFHFCVTGNAPSRVYRLLRSPFSLEFHNAQVRRIMRLYQTRTGGASGSEELADSGARQTSREREEAKSD